MKLREISSCFDMKVFTDQGNFFGEVEEAIITHTKVHGWRVRSAKNSYLSKVLGSAKGVIVPHQYVKAIGDVMLISEVSLPTTAGGEVEPKNETSTEE